LEAAWAGFPSIELDVTLPGFHVHPSGVVWK
jgi:hypothetical protein